MSLPARVVPPCTNSSSNTAVSSSSLVSASYCPVTVAPSHLGYASMPLPNTAPMHVQSSHCVTLTSSSNASLCSLNTKVHQTSAVSSSPSVAACPRPSTLKLKPMDLNQTPGTTSDVDTAQGPDGETWGLGWLGNWMAGGGKSWGRNALKAGTSAKPGDSQTGSQV